MKKILVCMVVGAFALILSGCGIAGHYVVTQYGGNAAVNTYHATNYSIYSRVISLNLAGTNQIVASVPGAWVLEPEAQAPATYAGKNEYTARLIGVGGDLRKWTVERFSIGVDSVLGLTLPGHRSGEVLVSGNTVILERLNRVFGTGGSPHFRITLFDETNKIVGKWEVESYSSNHGWLSLTPVGGASDDIVIFGHCEAETLKPL